MIERGGVSGLNTFIADLVCVCVQISSLQGQIISQEAAQQTQEKELNRAKTDLYCLEQEEKQLEENLRAGKAKLESILKLLKTSQNEMDEVGGHTLSHSHTKDSSCDCSSLSDCIRRCSLACFLCFC